MFPIYVDNDIEIRLLEKSIAKELYSLSDRNRSHLRKWLPWVDGTTSISDTEKFIESGQKQFKKSNGFQAGIWYQGHIAGAIGIHEVDRANKKTSMGYWLAKDQEGKGIVTKSVRAVVDLSFNQLGLHRVEIRCATGNKKSLAIPERLGFKNEGTLREVEWLYDHFEDLVVYSILSTEWPSQIVL